MTTDALYYAAIVEHDAEQLTERIGQLAGARQAAMFRAAAQMVHREVAVAEGQPPVGQCAGQDQIRREGRGGVRRHEMVDDLVVRLEMFGKIESIERTPFRGDERLDPEEPARLDDAEVLVRRALRKPGFQEEGRGLREAPEADVGDEGPAGELHAQQHVAAPGEGTLRPSPHDARREPAHLEAEELQHSHEQEVLLVAIAAARAGDQFRLDG